MHSYSGILGSRDLSVELGGRQSCPLRCITATHGIDDEGHEAEVAAVEIGKRQSGMVIRWAEESRQPPFLSAQWCPLGGC